MEAIFEKFTSIPAEQLKGLVVGVWILSFFALERLWPKASLPQQVTSPWARLGRNAGLWLCNSLLSLSVILPLTKFAGDLGWGWREALGVSEGWIWLLVNLALLDLWIYAWHRLMHEVQFFWRFHQVHHLDQFLDVTSAVRFHFGEVFLSALLRAGVIILLDIPIAHIILFEAIVLLAAIFHHSNLALPRWLESPLAWVIVTPSHHWVHHHALRKDTDSNYGTLFSFWDRIFASKSQTERFAEMPIGVEGIADKPLLKLLSIPFGRQTKPRKKDIAADELSAEDLSRDQQN